jgi:hypothetical protein
MANRFYETPAFFWVIQTKPVKGEKVTASMPPAAISLYFCGMFN